MRFSIRLLALVGLLLPMALYAQKDTVYVTGGLQHESAKIFRLVRSIDPDAFVSQSKVRGVFGQGFNSINEMA